jgi:hypothetical protein
MLLKLQHSPEAQKLMLVYPLLYQCTWLMKYDSAATNAANSPLLFLPPEVRCRVYDYAFGGVLFHLTAAASEYSTGTTVLYRTLCHSPQPYASLPFRNCASRILPSSETSSPQCTKPRYAPKLERSKIPVHMLQVCRQIYHEAVLKPFVQIQFQFDIGAGFRGLRSASLLQEKLVPEQGRAIAHLCVIANDGVFISPLLTSKFEGLKHLEMHITDLRVALGQDNEFQPLKWTGLAQDEGVKPPKKLGLRSLRFTTSPQPDEDKAFVLEWIQHQETEILSKQQPMSTAD